MTRSKPATTGDRRMVSRRDRMGIEEAAAVVELDLPGRRQRCEGVLDLRGDRAGRHGFLQRVLPQVAHQAAPGAFAVRQEDRGDWNDFSGRSTRAPRRTRRAATGRAMLRQAAGRESSGRAPRPASDTEHGDVALTDTATGSACGIRLRERQTSCSCRPRTAPCWKRRFGKTGISIPVTAATPRETISPLSRVEPVDIVAASAR